VTVGLTLVLRRMLRQTLGAAGLCIMLAALLSPTTADAADAGNVCTTAALTNPDAIPPATGGIGGTGILAERKPLPPGTGGMGGTGVMADAKPVPPGTGGMGGTGIVADVVPGTGGMGGTGIVGIITGFASICVNNVEVHYDANTPVSVNGRLGTARELAVGHVVAVQARVAGNRLEANGIGVIDAIAGPVTRVNAATREVQVMGQTVRVDAATDLSNLRVGVIARVSGHRGDNGDVIASRIDTGTGAAAGASVIGTVTRVEADALVVNGTRVNLGGRGTRGITVGSEVFAAGDWTGTALRAQRVDAQPVRNAIARNERAIVEGYVRGRTSRELNVGGTVIQLDDRVRYNGGSNNDAGVGRKVQVEIRRSGGNWHAERVILQRDDRPTRSGQDVTGRQSGGDSSRGSGESSRGGGESGRSDSGPGSRDSGSGSRDSGRTDSRDAGRSGSSGSSSGSGRDGRR
jgi:hypothetical protein